MITVHRSRSPTRSARSITRRCAAATECPARDNCAGCRNTAVSRRAEQILQYTTAMRHTTES